MPHLTHGRILVESDDRILRITLDRPDAGNAIDLEMAQDLLEAAGLVTAGAKAGLRAVLLSANGKMFCVGGDLKAFAAAPDRGELMHEVAHTAHRALDMLTSAPVPIVSAVHATAAGAGIGLALTADIVIASDTAKFKMAYTAAGLSPDFGTSWILARDLGLARSLNLALTNRLFSATEAEQWGLISEVAGTDAFDQRVTEILESLAAGPTEALGATKQLLREHYGHSYREHLDIEEESIARLVNRPDGYEGIGAFIERRTPNFR